MLLRIYWPAVQIIRYIFSVSNPSAKCHLVKKIVNCKFSLNTYSTLEHKKYGRQKGYTMNSIEDVIENSNTGRAIVLTYLFFPERIDYYRKSGIHAGNNTVTTARPTEIQMV